MADRTVSVALRLNNGQFMAAIGQSAAATKGLAREVGTATGKAADGYQSIGLAASAAGAVVAVGLGKAVSASMNFEKSLSGLRAATGATGAAMEKLRASALKAGEDTSFSATQAAEAQTALAKAGVSTADILGGGARRARSTWPRPVARGRRRSRDRRDRHDAVRARRRRTSRTSPTCSPPAPARRRATSATWRRP